LFYFLCFNQKKFTRRKKENEGNTRDTGSSIGWRAFEILLNMKNGTK